MLQARALRVREHVVRMSAGGGCFLGAALSCADLLVYLYARVLRLDPTRPADPARDYFLLSKGHAAPALYATLAESGFLEPGRLGRHLAAEDDIYWHPNPAVPGVEFHSGSLGHLAAVAVGIALDIKLRRGANRVYLLLGDGELNEGSIWEAALVARAHRLENLIWVVDRNELQANVATEALIPLEPLSDKLRAFGLSTCTIDGHCFSEMGAAFAAPPTGPGPRAVIARTVRGKGLPSLEGRVDGWFVRSDEAEVARLLGELRTGSPAARLYPVPS